MYRLNIIIILLISWCHSYVKGGNIILHAINISTEPPWGFYGHKVINRMAVFTLPPEMMGFFKKNIAFITEHAVDPDKRRYATKHEGVRHYIDIDIWDTIPFKNIPRDFEEALIKHITISKISGNDTSNITIIRDNIPTEISFIDSSDKVKPKTFTIAYDKFLKYWKSTLTPLYYEDEWKLSNYDISALFHNYEEETSDYTWIFYDHFSEHGILPYHLESMTAQLTQAFFHKNNAKILRLATELGHYIGDGHVPLHTTKNYNGQLTNQVGIHAFWESRIPELFAEDKYDFFIGKASYIENPQSYFWQIITDSHALLDSVLLVEKRLSLTFPSDRQYCYDERLGTTVRIQCKEYTEAYSSALGSMVEDRMRASISALGSVWYTAWVNAGQPTLVEDVDIHLAEESIVPDKNIKTRAHDN